jgi:hypothetical protein
MNKQLTDSQRKLTKEIIAFVGQSIERPREVCGYIARELQISRQAVHLWLTRGIPPKPERYFQWFQSKGVPLEDLLRSRGLE